MLDRNYKSVIYLTILIFLQLSIAQAGDAPPVKASGKEVRVLVSYKGKWNNVLTRYSIPTVLKRAANQLNYRLKIYWKNHGPFMTDLFKQSSFNQVQDNYFNFKGGAADASNVLKLDFIRQYLKIDQLRAFLIQEKISHIVFPGGQAVSPFFYDRHAQEDDEDYVLWRDIKEIGLLLLAKDMGIPVLAICRGMQLTNAVMGGTINHRIMDDIAEPNGVDWNIHLNGSTFRPLHHPFFMVNPSVLVDIYLPGTPQKTPIVFSQWKVTSIHQHSIEKVSSHLDVQAFVPITMPKQGTNMPDDVDLGVPYVYRQGFDVVEAVTYNGPEFWLLGIQFHAEYLSRSARSIRMYKTFLQEGVRRPTL